MAGPLTGTRIIEIAGIGPAPFARAIRSWCMAALGLDVAALRANGSIV